MPVTVFTAKVIGTVSIGLWAGYNLSFVSKDIRGSELQAPVRWFQQQLLGCTRRGSVRSKAESSDVDEAESEEGEQPFNAGTALASLARSLPASLLSGIVCAANITAYTFSNRASKHPYLLYLALGAPLVGALQFFGARELWTQIKAADTAHEEPSELSESTYEHVSVPGDSVASNSGVSLKSKFSIYSVAVAGLSTFLYTISVIGLAGDTTVRF